MGEEGRSKVQLTWKARWTYLRKKILILGDFAPKFSSGKHFWNEKVAFYKGKAFL
jgi:hypothetical protein